jgi:hypothetical protein
MIGVATGTVIFTEGMPIIAMAAPGIMFGLMFIGPTGWLFPRKSEV